MSDPADDVIDYHQRTKHQLHAYAKGPETLDWEDQPNPFRCFAGCQTMALPKPGRDTDCLFGELDKPELIAPRPLCLDSIGLLLELSFGISAWKQYGPERWALRCNPSSGNLHPTEAYVLCCEPALMPPGVYHYQSHDHRLERRSRFPDGILQTGIYIGLSSVHWREAWKYGERAYRYCQHDIGHALASMSYAAACLGWTVELCSEAGDAEIAAWLGLDRNEDFIPLETEATDLFCRLHTGQAAGSGLNAGYLSEISATAQWFGIAEPLSKHHFYRWPIIEKISAQARKPATIAERQTLVTTAMSVPNSNIAASHLIRRRRSAQRFNPRSAAMPRANFLRILHAVLPGAKPPFTAWNWSPQVHLCLFVHRVADLEPGLYLLPRTPDAVSELRSAFSADFIWEAADAPFPFYRLLRGNFRQAARTLSCHQAIAGDSAFSLGMLSKFADNVANEAWRYRRLFWECGLIGQILYLEAEAAGFRGTGIGCYFDDAFHGILGLTDHNWQSLYHFTVGEALEDSRLQTLPAYAHLAI